MGLFDGLAAKARGEVSAADLIAYGRACSDAYDLLDSLPPSGYARLSAWNAYVLQTYADKLLAAGRAPGYVAPETADQVRVLYEYVEQWLVHARQAAASESHRLDVYLPQAMPHQWRTTPRTLEQLAGMREALVAAQARVAADLAAFAGAAGARDRLQGHLIAVSSTAEYVDGLWTAEPGPELRQTTGDSLRDGLDRAYELGQVIAVPELLDELHDAPPPGRPAVPALRLPGEPGFDPWCLTDPLERIHMEHDAAYRAALDRLWEADEHPERTLAIEAEISAARARGAVDFLPAEQLGLLSRLADHCPWPGVLVAKTAVMIGGRQIDAGDRFVFTVSHDEGPVERTVVVAPTSGRLAVPDDLPPAKELGWRSLFELLVDGGYGVYGLDGAGR